MCEEYKVSEMFNSECKTAFVERLIENLQAFNTIKNIENFLLRCEEFEESMTNGKDLKDFSLNEVFLMLKWWQSSSIDTLVIYSHYIADYIKFAKDNNYTKNTLDFGQLLTSKILKEEVVNNTKREGKYITYSTYKEIKDAAEDFTTQCVIELLWNGFSIDEIVEMKITDLDFKNETIKNKKVSYNLLKLCRRAHEEYQYTFTLKCPEKPIIRSFVKSDYIIKGYDTMSGSKAAITDNIQKSGVNKKIKEVTTYLDLSYVTPDTISKSGLLYDLYDKGMENAIRSDVAEYIMEVYGYSASPAYKLIKIFHEIYLPKIKEELEA